MEIVGRGSRTLGTTVPENVSSAVTAAAAQTVLQMLGLKPFKPEALTPFSEAFGLVLVDHPSRKTAATAFQCAYRAGAL